MSRPFPDLSKVDKLLQQTGVMTYVVTAKRFDASGLIETVPTEKLSGWLREVVKVEAPIHADLLLRRLLDLTETPRKTAAVEAHLEAALNHGLAHNRFVADGQFIQLQAIPPFIRNREALDGPFKRFEYIYPEEIRLAILKVVRDTFGISRSDLGSAVAALFGYKRKPPTAETRIQQIVDDLILEELLVEQAGDLKIPL